MNSGVRVIKRERADGPQGLPPGRGEKTDPQGERELSNSGGPRLVRPSEKTDRQRERELAGAVKGWINEWEKAKAARRTECLRRFRASPLLTA